MVLIRAVVRPEKSDAVLAALLDAGFPAVTKCHVYGRGKQRGLKVGDVHYDELPKELLYVVVPEKDRPFVIQTIMNAARTGPKGAFGDGKIFVTPVEEVYTVSSGVCEKAAEPVAVQEFRGNFDQEQAMKEVLAVIRMNKMNQTKQALAEAGISAFHARPVYGRGRGQVDFRVLEGAKDGHPEAIAQLGNGPKLMPKRMLSVIVPDDRVKPVIETIIKANRTGNAGDGKVFVLPCAEVVRIRTGERDDAALDEVI